MFKLSGKRQREDTPSFGVVLSKLAASSLSRQRREREASEMASLFLSPPPSKNATVNTASLTLHPTRPDPISTTRPNPHRFRCSAGQAGFFTRLGRLIKEKAKSDVDKVFSGFSKTRDNLAVIDELLLYWNLSDTDRVLDELEEVPSLSLYTHTLKCKCIFEYLSQVI